METSYRLNNKVCRVCLEEGIFTSIFSAEFAVSPFIMLQTLDLKVYESDPNLPIGICNNCYYRLSLAYHFKQQCENSDLRLRQYFGIRIFDTKRDATTNTDAYKDETKEDDEMKQKVKTKRRSRYKPKTELKKRGPKPTPKVVHQCYQCNKTFKCLAQLQMHLRTHTGEKPFQCDYCNRRFAQKHNLIIHVRIHTGDKPFVCEICSKQFSAHGNFIAHKKIHSGVRDHVCPVCNKTFITSSDMSRHLSTHTGLKNFICDICNKAFTRNRDMVMHKRKIHLNERAAVPNIKCTECRKVFPTGESLQIHVAKEHAHLPQQLQIGVPELPPNLEQHSIHHNLPGPHHLHHPHHHQALIQAPLLPPHPGMMVASSSVGYHPHQRLHPY